MKKVFIGMALGVSAYLSLGIFPYFPERWSICFALLVLFVGCKFIRAAIFITMLMFAVSLSYHSIELSMWYIIIAFFFAMVTIWFSSFPELFLLIAGAPLLATFAFLKFSIPLEFSIIFLAPILLKGNKAPVIAGIACFWCCVLGMINQHELIGHLVIGAPIYKFYSLNPLPEVFYNFGWIKVKFGELLAQDFYRIIGNLGKSLLSQPLVFFQVIVWGVISYFMKILIEKKKWWLDLIGTFSVIGILALLQFTTTLLYPWKIEFDLPGFLSTAVPTMLVILGFLELRNLLSKKRKPETLYIEKERTIPRQVAPRYTSQAVVDKRSMEVEKLSLEDSMEMQKRLGDHIKKKFVHEVTALDIDIVGSAKLKHGEAQEDVVFSFKRYWEFMDATVRKSKGRLLNRTGDEAIYIFDDPNQAVLAPQEIFKDLEKFNKIVNILKSPFSARIGINTGEVVEDPSKNSNDVFSRVFDIAGHLQKMARPQEILISEDTYKKLRNKDDFESSGYSTRDHVRTYTLKGSGVSADTKA